MNKITGVSNYCICRNPDNSNSKFTLVLKDEKGKILDTVILDKAKYKILVAQLKGFGLREEF